MLEVVRWEKAQSCPSTWDYSAGYYWNGEIMIPICEAQLPPPFSCFCQTRLQNARQTFPALLCCAVL